MADSTQKFTVSEFGIIFNVRGNAQKALHQMARDIVIIDRKLSRLGKTMRGMKGGTFGAAGGGVGLGGGGASAMTGGITRAGKAMSGGGAMASRFGSGLEMVSMNAEAAASALYRVAGAISGPLISAFENGLDQATELEASIVNLEFVAEKAFGKEYTSTVSDKVEAIGLKTNQTTDQVRKLTAALTQQNIDPFSKSLDNLVTKSGGATTALEVMADAAILTRGGMQRLRFAVAEVASEGTLMKRRGLTDALNLGIEQMKEYNKELKKGKTQQDKFNIIMRLMARDFGGVAAAQGNLLSFVMQQWDDIYDKVVKVLFIDTGVTQMFADSLKGVQDYLLKLAASPQRLEKLKRVMKDIVTVLIAVGKFFANILRFVIEFVAENPNVIKMALAFGGVLTVVAMLFGAVATLTGFVAALVVTFGFLAPIIGPLLPILGAVAAIGAAIVIVFAGLARYIVGGKDWVETWERVKAVFQGVWQMLTNMNSEGNTFIDGALGMKLASMGLLQTTIKIAKFLYNIGQFIVGMGGGIKTGFLPYWESASDIFGETVKTVGNLVGMFLQLVGLGNLFGTGAESTGASWKTLGNIIGQILMFGFTVMGYFMKAGTAMLKVFNAFVEIIRPFIEWLVDKVQWVVDQVIKIADKLDVGKHWDSAVDWVSDSDAGQWIGSKADAVSGALGGSWDPEGWGDKLRKGMESTMVAETGQIESAKAIEKAVQTTGKAPGEAKAMSKAEMDAFAKMIASAVGAVSLKLNGRELNEGLADTVVDAAEVV